MVEEECGSLVELEEEKVDVSTLERADEKPAPKKWVARPIYEAKNYSWKLR